MVWEQSASAAPSSICPVLCYDIVEQSRYDRYYEEHQRDRDITDPMRQLSIVMRETQNPQGQPLYSCSAFGTSCSNSDQQKYFNSCAQEYGTTDLEYTFQICTHDTDNGGYLPLYTEMDSCILLDETCQLPSPIDGVCGRSNGRTF